MGFGDVVGCWDRVWVLDGRLGEGCVVWYGKLMF